MNGLVILYRRLDRLQQQLWLKVLATVIVLIGCGGGFGYLIVASHNLDAERAALERALSTQNLQAGDPLAVSLQDSGAVTLRGTTYGGAWLAGRDDLFDSQGNIAHPSALASAMVRWRLPEFAPDWLLEQPGTTWLLALCATALLLLIVWMHILLPYLITAAATALFMWLFLTFQRPQWALAVFGIGNLFFAFILLTRASLLLFHSPRQVLAVAHTTIREASRTRIALAFIIILLLLIPLLPLWLDPDQPLRYRVQTYIARSFGLTFVIAACMTLFLSCATVAFEIRDRQIWQLVSKPLGKFKYLLGKWAGVMTVNLILLLIASLCTFSFIQYLRMQPVAGGLEGQVDAVQLRDQVLTARVGVRPVYATMPAEDVALRVEQVILDDPELAGLETVPRSVRQKLARNIRQQFAGSLRSVPPVMDGRPGARTYTFRGLGPAKSFNSTLTLRYRFYMLRNDEHETFNAAFVFNDDPNTWIDRTYVPTMTHVLSLPPDLVQEDGTLKVAIVNLHSPRPNEVGTGAINFDEDGLEMLYKVASFESNFFRAVLMSWIKLAFLAALGIALSTFLSFPVACLFSFTIFLAATLGPFLAASLQEYNPPSAAHMDWADVGAVIQWAFQWTIRSIAQVLVFALRAFGEYRPTQSLIEGKVIFWFEVLKSFLILGVFWSGLAMILGFVVVRSRQLAIYSGHG